MQNGEPTTPRSTTGRANQKLRTRNAILQAAAELIRTGDEVTMLEVAKAALVSEATTLTRAALHAHAPADAGSVTRR